MSFSIKFGLLAYFKGKICCIIETSFTDVSFCPSAAVCHANVKNLCLASTCQVFCPVICLRLTSFHGAFSTRQTLNPVTHQEFMLGFGGYMRSS